MADNQALIDQASGGMFPVGFKPATDDVSGVAYQRVKLDVGDDGATSPVTASNPLPVSGAVTISGGATAANQTTANASLDSIDDKLTDANAALLQIEAHQGDDITSPTAMPAGGSGIRGWLSAIWTKLNGSIAVTGTFWQATQPVSGSVTANAGTNLNTSSLALESGGNLASVASDATDILAVETQIEAHMGDDISAPTAMPAGGSGIRGWLSAIWTKLNTGITVTAHAVTNAGTFAVQAAGALPGGGTTGWSVASGSIGATKTDIGTANTAGQVGGYYFYNPNSSVAYVQFFNAQASAVTLGTTTPIYSLGIPATSGANIAPGLLGLNHSTAICIAITTTRAGSTGPGSTVDYNIFYKQ